MQFPLRQQPADWTAHWQGIYLILFLLFLTQGAYESSFWEVQICLNSQSPEGVKEVLGFLGASLWCMLIHYFLVKFPNKLNCCNHGIALSETWNRCAVMLLSLLPLEDKWTFSDKMGVVQKCGHLAALCRPCSGLSTRQETFCWPCNTDIGTCNCSQYRSPQQYRSGCSMCTARVCAKATSATLWQLPPPLSCPGKAGGAVVAIAAVSVGTTPEAWCLCILSWVAWLL